MKTSLTIFTFLYAICVFSQNEILIAYSEAPGGRQGYCSESGEIIIPAKYDQAHMFSNEGLAFVYDSRRRKWSTIDVKGSEVQMPLENYTPTSKSRQYDNNLGFINGFATLNIRGNDAVVGVNGNIIFPADYSRIAPFNNGVAHAVKDKEDYLLHSNGKEYKIKTKIRNIKMSEEAVAMNMIPIYGGDKEWGYVDVEGNVVIETKFDKVGEFSEDSIAWAIVTTDDVGFINWEGEWITDPIYDYASNFDPVADVALVRTKQGKFLLINREGEEIELPKEIEKVYSFSEGLGRVRVDGNFGKLGFINANGEYVIEPKYNTLKYFESGIALANDGKYWGGINKLGETVIPFEFDKIKGPQDGVYIISKENRYGFFIVDENMIIDPVYSEVRAFKDGFAAVRDAKSLKWGLINMAGELMFEPKFYDLFFATEIK